MARLRLTHSNPELAPCGRLCERLSQILNPTDLENSAERPNATLVAIGRARIQSVDILRGLIMIIMVLDHVRDFFHNGAQHFSPTDLGETTPALFFTRWITHFCAPTFMFLAGVSAYLQCRRGKSRGDVARFLWTRGLWLVLLELTWVRWAGWRMNFGNDQIFLWVIWALGFSMIALAGLIFIPWRTLLAVSLTVIVAHNALDAINPTQLGTVAWLWNVLHVPGSVEVGDTKILTTYPLIPWVFVMSAGYCFGRVMDLESDERRRLLFWLGSGLVATFLILRWTNLYGDPSPWSRQRTLLLTAASFANCTKYPPSLLFLFMTLGPGIVALGFLERVHLMEQNPLVVFGRVPLFYYLVHLPLIHGLAIAMSLLRYHRAGFMFDNPPSLWGSASIFPADYGYSLVSVYVIWICVVLALYPACRWFADLKQSSPAPLLSYL
jgi:uncharacterized membrane protein